MNARIVLMGGLGFPVTETFAGMPTLKARFEAIKGVEVLLISWKQRTEAYNFMHGFTGFRAYLGDSLGAGSAAQYPADVHGTVQFAGGFQPSMWDARTHSDQITVAANCAVAHAIYDPYWIDTGGLGYSTYAKQPGAKTIIMNTGHRGAHPDDWGWSQDLLYHHCVSLMGK